LPQRKTRPRSTSEETGRPGYVGIICGGGRNELEWQHLKKDKLCGQIFDDELDLAYAVIDGVQARGEKGNHSTQRIKFYSNSSG